MNLGFLPTYLLVLQIYLYIMDNVVAVVRSPLCCSTPFQNGGGSDVSYVQLQRAEMAWVHLHNLGPAWGLVCSMCNLRAIAHAWLYRRPNLLTCEVMRPSFRSWCSRGESVVKKINVLWTIDRDVSYPTDEPSLAHVEGSSWGKAHPNFIEVVQRFGAKTMPPGTPHGMSECLGPTMV